MQGLITRFTVPAVHVSVGGVRNKLIDDLKGLLTTDQLDTVRLAVSEIVTNATEHGTGGEDGNQDLQVEATAYGARRRLRVAVINPCRTRTVPTSRPGAAHDVYAESGRGLYIVEMITAEVGSELLPGDDGQSLLCSVWFEIDVDFPAMPGAVASAAAPITQHQGDRQTGLRRPSVRRTAGRLLRLPRRAVARRGPATRAAPQRRAA
ncbi:ATP-binding protein [Kitasatospora sp. NRRL B-11411]|uniref:ATP-binding protein n=1 Tax=Kitasatospora sp. NRRL B-11411 TaxID=1463822 RepID=UPI00068FAFD4|nr:ATP-binding protein [Kitasatospora sp. NRRL B-11411]